MNNLEKRSTLRGVSYRTCLEASITLCWPQLRLLCHCGAAKGGYSQGWRSRGGEIVPYLSQNAPALLQPAVTRLTSGIAKSVEQHN